MPQFEKNPGPDWVVDYQWLGKSDDQGVESMMIYGAATSEIALDEARYSLDAGRTPYVIIGLTMLDDQGAKLPTPLEIWRADDD